MTTDPSADPLTGARVREVRLAAGMNQFQLAEATGLSRGTIQLIEGGARITPASRVALLAVFPDLQAPGSVLEKVQAELADLRNRIDALTAGQAA